MTCYTISRILCTVGAERESDRLVDTKLCVDVMDTATEEEMMTYRVKFERGDPKQPPCRSQSLSSCGIGNCNNAIKVQDAMILLLYHLKFSRDFCQSAEE